MASKGSGIDLLDADNFQFAFTRAVLFYLPVFVSAVLWSIRRGEVSGKSSRRAGIAGSYLDAFMLLVWVLPAIIFGIAFFYD